jgi:hypothetical protein
MTRSAWLKYIRWNCRNETISKIEFPNQGDTKMRLILVATAVALISSAAIAAPAPATGSGSMMGTANMTGSGNMTGTGNMMGSGTMKGPGAKKGSAMMMGSGTMMIHQKVADYAKWRVVYDADQANRSAAGLTNCKVLSSMDDANDVMVSCNMSDLAKAKAFASSKTLADAMTRAGVVGKPDIMYLTSPK